MNRLIPLVIILLILCISLANAESIFAPGGIGYSTRSMDVRTAGLGGTGLALADSMYLNPLNPSSWQSTGITRFTVGFRMFKNTVTTNGNDDKTDGTDLSGISLAMPIYKSLGLGIFYQPLYDHRYLVNIEDEAEPLENNPSDSTFEYLERNQGKGGLSRVGVVLAARSGKLSYGLSGDFYFGKLEDYWEMQFENQVLDTSSQYVRREMTGLGLSAGVIYDLNPQSSLAAAVKLPVRLDADYIRRISAGAWYQEDSKLHFELPLEISLGSALRKNRYRASLDMKIAFWSKTSRNWLETSGDLPYDDCFSFSFGLERLPLRGALDHWLQKLIYRTGFHYDEHYFQTGGNKVKEYGFALGIGSPLRTKAGIVDFALTYDKRGSESDNGLAESAIGFQIGWTNREKWFVRHRR